MKILKQFERADDGHITIGNFNRDEIKWLEMNGYRETWRELVQKNKHGIPVRCSN